MPNPRTEAQPTGSHRREERIRASEAIEDYAKAIHALTAFASVLAALIIARNLFLLQQLFIG